MDLVQEIILQHGLHSPNKRELQNPTLSIVAENKLCGDTIRIDLIIDRDKITDITFSGDGCLISQATASLLADEAKRVKNIDKIKKFDKDFILNLLGIQLTFSRIKCALLSLEALQKTLINY